MQLTTLKEVSAGGHVAGRDVNVTNNLPQPRSQIAVLYERLKAEAGTAPVEETKFIEDLQHYFNKPATTITRSLEQKLADTGRSDLVGDAEEAKERAMKRIMRFQSSQTAQAIFAYTLGDIRTRFNHHIRPLIAAGASRLTIDSAIYEYVLQPVASSAEPSDLGINPTLSEALFYFLAGNCHIKWD